MGGSAGRQWTQERPSCSAPPKALGQNCSGLAWGGEGDNFYIVCVCVVVFYVNTDLKLFAGLSSLL